MAEPLDGIVPSTDTGKLERLSAAQAEAPEAIESDEVTSDMAPVVDANGMGPNGKRIRARVVHERDLERYLGAPRFSYGMAEEQDEVGVSTGVSWTPVGGDTISVEVSLMEGKGGLLLTGQLGDVMKESAQAALQAADSAPPAENTEA